MGKIKEILLDLIFPVECVFCGHGNKWLCDTCLSGINFKYTQECPICRTRRREGEICDKCRPVYAIDRVVVAGDYNDEGTKKLIKLLKYRFIKDISDYLGDFITFFLSEIKEKSADKIYQKSTFLTPIPLHKKRWNWRGFNQSELIARKLSENLGLDILKGLERVKYKQPQTHFKKEARLNNMKNSFAWRGENLKNKKIILVDDVITTGATLNEAAKELKKAGARRVEALVVARE